MIRTTQDDQILKVLKSFIVREISWTQIYHPSDTWGAKEAAFASHYRIASGILVGNSLPIVSNCDYSVLEKSLTSATLNVNSLLEVYVHCKFSKLGFRCLKTPFHWRSSMLSSIMTECWGKVALEQYMKVTGMVRRLPSSESLIYIQWWVELWILESLFIYIYYLACRKWDQNHETT